MRVLANILWNVLLKSSGAMLQALSQRDALPSRPRPGIFPTRESFGPASARGRAGVAGGGARPRMRAPLGARVKGGGGGSGRGKVGGER